MSFLKSHHVPSSPVRRILMFAAATAALLGSIHPAHAVDTRALTDNSFSDFNKGVSTGTQILDQGRVQPGPVATRLAKSAEGLAWKIAADPATGAFYYSTGHSGKVFRVADGKQELWADLAEVEATALTVGADGALYIGASPGGKIYTAAQKSKPALFAETGEKYVWDLAVAPDGSVYAATGTTGKIFKISSSDKKPHVYYDSDATNVMDLDFDESGSLLAATQGKAYLLRISAENEAYILYAASQDELRTMTVDADSNIYAAANSARISSVFDKASTASAAAGDTSKLGGEGLIVKVYPNGFVDALWKAPEGPVHAILADANTSSVLAAAGKSGKLYRVDTSDGSYSVIADVDEPMISALAAAKAGKVLLATANKAAVYEMQTSAQAAASLFASRALDAQSTVRWGNLTFDGELAAATDITWDTRSGNTPEPSDDLWSPWTSAPAVGSRIVKIASPVAQYLQYRISFHGQAAKADSGAFVDAVRVYYVEKNVPPVIKSITAEKVPSNTAAAQAAALTVAAAKLQSASSGKADDSKAKEASAEAAKAASAARAAILARVAAGADVQNTQKLNVTWTASDANQDTLRYSLYFKGEDEKVWKLIEENATDSKHQFSTEAIPDGQYRFKLEATDRFDNPATSASTVQLVSRVYTVDNTPPEIEQLQAHPTGPGQYNITVKAADKTSIIAQAEYNLDASEEWLSLAPKDAIFDFQTEEFRFTVKPEKPQPEHTLSVRIYDREGNSRVEKVLLK